MSDLVRVAVDAMGGDHAPAEIVKGAVDAARDKEQLAVTLFGDEEAINAELAKYDYPKDRIVVHGTSETIEMAEPPVNAIRTKKDSSLVVGMKAVKEAQCDAIVTAGSTGATLVGGQIVVGRIKGIERTPLAPILPSRQGPFLLIDCGANVDPKPSNLVQFAQMGSIYMENMCGIRNPRVGLLNIGTEEEKGNALTHEVYPLLQALDTINFIGNVEARDLPNGVADVVVTDAFSGNIALKMYEGTAKVLLGEITGVLKSSVLTKLGASLIVRPLKKTLKKYDAKQYGGAPLLGCSGLVVKAHGSARAAEIHNAIIQCIDFKEHSINDQFKDRMHLVDRTRKSTAVNQENAQ